MKDTLQSNKTTVHDILVNQARLLDDDVIAVCASSGIDSWSVIFALLEVGKKVHVYSFTLEDRESCDFLFARMLAKKYDLQFTPIYLPISLDVLKQDLLFLSKFDCKKKVEFECVWPFLYIYRNCEENTIGSGLCADGYFCISKSGMIHYRNDMDKFRQNYFSNNGSQYIQHYSLGKYFCKTIFIPYKSQDMYEFFIGKSWEECNTPRQKVLIYNAFIDEFNDNDFKCHTNLHLGDSGISSHFEKLLKTDWNLYNYKSVVGIYNSINRGELPIEKRKLI